MGKKKLVLAVTLALSASVFSLPVALAAEPQAVQSVAGQMPPAPQTDENGNPLPPPDFGKGQPPAPPTDENGRPLPPPNGVASPQNMSGNLPAFGPAAGGQTKSAAELTAQKVVDGATEKLTDVTLAATAADESAVLVRNGGSLSLTKGMLSKTGDAVSADASNFSGANAVLLAADSKATLDNVLLTSDADGANAVFATGEQAKIRAQHLRIHTKKDSSRGLDATYGGTIEAADVDITTEGAHCAALATDRGEGTVTVHDGTFQTSGAGSPNVYSTGRISVYDSQGQARGSEIAVVEGKNSIYFENVHLSGAKDHGIMLYQSFSGDAGIGEAQFTAKDSGLTNLSDGPFFFVTNTKAIATLENNELETKGDTLVKVAASRWGKTGANGGDFTLKAKHQHLSGKIVADSISEVTLDLGDGAAYVGAFNTENSAKAANLSLTKKASLMLTADAYVTAFSDARTDFQNIKSRGHNLYYDAAASTALGGKTYELPGGGKLLPKN